jgi:hypothetical protein
LIEALSTAEVTALMCSGDPFVCASAEPAEIARPNAIAIAACASRAVRYEGQGASGKKRQAESTRGERVILIPPNDL